jgi:hypothetical protein
VEKVPKYNTPSDTDLIEQIKVLEDRIARMDLSLRAASTVIDTGTFRVVDPTTGITLLYIGLLPNGDYGIELYRDDGTIAMRVGRATPTDGSQIINIYNRSGDAIHGDQFLNPAGAVDTGIVLEPVKASEYTTPVAVTSGTFVDTHIFRGVYVGAQPRVKITAICTDGTTAGEFRLADAAGNSLTGFFGATVDPKAIPTGTTSETDFENDQDPNYFYTLALNSDYFVKLQVRRTAGAGTINIKAKYLQQRPG